MDEAAMARIAAREGIKRANGQSYNFEQVDPMDSSTFPAIPPIKIEPAQLVPKGGRNV